MWWVFGPHELYIPSYQPTTTLADAPSDKAEKCTFYVSLLMLMKLCIQNAPSAPAYMQESLRNVCVFCYGVLFMQ